MRIRGDIRRIVSNLSRKFPFPDYDFHVMEAYNSILTYCKENKVHPRGISVNMDGFLLVINGKPIARVVRSNGFIHCSDLGCYIEGLILERQEEMED